jgi:non-lysosomal glucosylceramidase
MLRRARAVLLPTLLSATCFAGPKPPDAAWKRPLGLPLEQPGHKKASITYPHLDDGYWQGAPVGGFGAGTFSRSYRGDFVRWHMNAGVHKYETVWPNQFAVYQKKEGSPESTAQVLYNGKPTGGALSSWAWDYPVGAGDYYALYPKAWYDYRWERFPAHVTLEQFSPVLPDNYKESSYPVAVYQWHVTNPTQERVTVSILFSWANLVGAFRGSQSSLANAPNAANVNRLKTETVSYQDRPTVMKGILFDRGQRTAPVTEQWDGQFAIAALEVPGVEISTLTTFAPGDGREVWEPFAKDGRLSNADVSWMSSGERLAGALAATVTLAPGESKTIPMVLSWDLPVAEFGLGAKWWREYTRFFGTSGQNAWQIARTGLTEGDGWSAAIDRWQAPYVQDTSKPDWYRGMLWNENYILADGGTLWGRPMGAPESTPSTFGLLECFDYPYYETLDVRFYGSMPLARFWPEIEKQVMRQFAATLPQASDDRFTWIWKSRQGAPAFRERKLPGSVPHDLGVPDEDPFRAINTFSWQDTGRWKDLNTKFVLLVYRDFVTSGRTDLEFLRTCWPAVKAALAYLEQFDTNGDGLPENQGYPDQTYDEWVVQGESAYCGGLWLAALRAAEEMAKLLHEPASAAKYHAQFLQGQRSFIAKLWNGSYFRYDTASEYRESVMADQLAGQWYANLTGLGDIVPAAMRRSALAKIFAHNVMKFEGGTLGAVNGIAPDGTALTSNEQVGEVWSGTTFGLAALMLSEGMRDEAFRTAHGVYHAVYERYGYWFRTPEAWDKDGGFRASMYMRPTAIWAMEMMPKPAAARSTKDAHH